MSYLYNIGMRTVSSTPFGFSRRLNPNESREITIANGKRRIQALAAAVRLSEHHVEMAHRWFVLALQHNFTKGRKSANVVAACLYIVCRQEKTSHMLLDFSEVLQVNVYTLGNTFLKLVRLLNLDLPLIDPSLFIGRFAAKLNLQENTQKIANVALRLVARMKRDWIQVGRRPSGICGACLLISCRLHGVEKSRQEIIQVVRVCDSTLKRRLLEFGETPSGQLTVEEFKGIWLEQEANPPSFKKRKNEEIDPTASSFSGDLKVDQEMEKLIAASMEKDEESGEMEKDEESGEMEEELAAALSGLEQTKTTFLADDGSIKVEYASHNTFDPISLSDVDDEEVDDCILQDEEIEIKTQVWMEMNGEYEMERLARHQEKEAQNQHKKPRKKREYNPNNRIKYDPLNPAGSAIEATKQMLQTKKFSKKINYDALDLLFNNE
jgi:transcription factor IIIB subunit 2